MAVALGVLVEELDDIVDVVSAAEKDGATLMYAGRLDVEDAPSAGSGDSASLRIPSEHLLKTHVAATTRTCSVRNAMGNAS